MQLCFVTMMKLLVLALFISTAFSATDLYVGYYGRNNNASLYKKNPKNYIYMSFEKNNNIIKKKNKSKNKSNNNKTFENVNLSKIYKNHHFI